MLIFFDLHADCLPTICFNFFSSGGAFMPDQPVELCFTCQHFYPIHGGGTLRFLRYFPEFRKRGVHTRVVTATPKASKLVDADYVRDWQRYPIGATIPAEPINGVPIHRIRLPEEKGWRRLVLFNREIVRFCRQPGYSPHVVQLFQALPHRSIPWLMKLRRSGIAVCYAYTSPAKLQGNAAKRFIRRWWLHELSRHLDCIIAVSAEMGRHVRMLGLKSRVEVIPNGVDLKRFRPSAAGDAQRRLLRESLGLTESSTLISTVGSIIPRKGTDLLLEAWRNIAMRSPDLHLAIIGTRFQPGQSEAGEFEKKIAALLKASGAADRVHFPGFVKDIENYLRASDLFVFSPLKEGMPNVVLEAMASALPVVLTPFPTLSEDLGRPGRDFLLVERHPQALSSAVERLIRDAEYRSDLGRSGRRWVEQTMDLDHVLDRYAALYRELAHRPM
jgi:glycosyltransferase involved in cell wall biosynthesis